MGFLVHLYPTAQMIWGCIVLRTVCFSVCLYICLQSVSLPLICTCLMCVFLVNDAAVKTADYHA